MTSPSEDIPLPTYSATDNDDLVNRIEASSGVEFPILHSPAGRSTNLQRLTVDADWNTYHEAYRIETDIVDAFFRAIENGHDDVVADFISRGWVSPDTTSRYRETPLIAAVRAGKLPMVSRLVALGASVNEYGRVKSEDKRIKIDDLPERTPLMVAAESGHLALVKVLIEDYGAKHDLIAPDGAMALRLAAINKHREIVQYLPHVRGGSWKRWMHVHRKQMERARRAAEKLFNFIRILVWDFPKLLLYEAPKELCCAVWRRRHKIKNFVKELPGKIKRGVIAIPGHVKSAGKAIWKGIKEIPSFVKYVFQSLWRVLKEIPGAIMKVLNWIGRGLKNIGEAISNIFMKFFSFLHTTLMAIVTFLRGITLRDIWNGFFSFVRAIFIDAPKAIGRFIVSFGRTIYDVLKALFGTLGECIWWLGYSMIWLIKYIPQKIWTIIEAMEMARRLVLSFYLASALHSFDVFASPCKPKPVTSHTVSIATSDTSTDLSSLTSTSESVATELSVSVSADISTKSSEGSESQTSSDGLSPSLSTTATTVTTDKEAVTTTSPAATVTASTEEESTATSGFATTKTTNEATATTGPTTTSSTDDDEAIATSSFTTTATSNEATDFTTDTSTFLAASGTTDSSSYRTSDTTLNASSLTSAPVTTEASSDTIISATSKTSDEQTSSLTTDTSGSISSSATTDTSSYTTEGATTDISSLTTDSTTTEVFSSTTSGATTATTEETTGLTTETSSITTGSATTDDSSYTSSGATTDTSILTTGSTTTDTSFTTSSATTDVSSVTTDTTTHITSESETSTTTTGPDTTTSADYCTNAEWQNDPLIASFGVEMAYAKSVCTTAIEPVTTVAATTLAETTVTELDTVIEDLPDETKIVLDAPSTDYVAGEDRTVTAVRRDGSIEIVEPKTIYNTVARTVIELPTAYETVYTTDVDYVGSTSVDTVYDVTGTETSVVITDTTEITTATSTDVTTETTTSIESIPTTSTEYVVTGTTIKFAPGMTIHVTNSRTFVVYSIPSTRTHVLYTTTNYLTSTWTTVTLASTDTDYTTIPTTTFDITTATDTVEETIATSTDTDFATSTITTVGWTTETTETSVSTSTSTKIKGKTYTQHEFPWLNNKKRAAIEARIPRLESLEEHWINEFGESHYHSACSCFLPDLPTRTVYASVGLETIFEKSTTIDKIYGETVTLTLTTAATVTTHKTVTDTTVVDGTTSIATLTVYEDVTETVLSTPTAQSLVTKVVTNDDVKQVTKEIAVIDTITLYGIATGYTWMEVTRTQDIYDLRSKLFPVVQTIDIAETSTSTLPTTTVETTVEVTSTALSTADETVYDAFTRVVPVAVRDVKKFTYTKTIFTDATSVYSIEATNTVGTMATTTLTTLTTVTNGLTSTITTVLSTQVTVTARPVETKICEMPIKDGDFEYPAGTSPWWKSVYSAFDWDKAYVDGHGKVMKSQNLVNYTSFIMWQDITSCAGVTFQCSYDYYIDKQYERVMKDPRTKKMGTWIPFIRTYWNDDIWYKPDKFLGNRFNQPDNLDKPYYPGQWYTASIEFKTSGGTDTLYIQAASPQEENAD
ncbi:hypothetical protein LB507_009116 [Fusarium sp. FIESC RH6]|nr:hypothetical protein LB507_009116 [Fusarium sp. FIESC RH6]